MEHTPIRFDPGRDAALRTFDAYAGEYRDNCAAAFQDGRRLAALDIVRLSGLADRLCADVQAWCALLAAMDLAAVSALSPVDAGNALLEWIFDDVLRPVAARVLAAAVRLGISAR